MMNFPFKIRKCTSYCTPKGPSFARAKRFRFSLDGTQIEFRAPQHKHQAKTIKPRYPESRYSFNEMIFHSNFDKEFQLTDSWEYFKLFYHRWSYNGDWFTGVLAELDFAMILIKPKQPNDKASYFHPRAFEQAVGDYLTNKHAIFKLDGRAKWIAPQNWQPINGLPVHAARLRVVPDELVCLDSASEYAFFPVADQCLLVMAFFPSQNGGGRTQSERDKLIDRSPMLALADDIINSLKITLSSEAQSQQAKALKDLDDTSLIKNFPPMKWTTPEEDTEWESKKDDWEEIMSG